MESQSTFALVDVFIVIVVLIFALLGLRSGFLRSLSTVLALVAATFGALHAGSWLNFSFGDITIPETLLPFVGFAVVFVVVWLVLRIVVRLIEAEDSDDKVGRINRPLGLLFGFAKGVVAVIAVAIIFDLGSREEAFFKESALLPIFLDFQHQVNSIEESANKLPPPPR